MCNRNPKDCFDNIEQGGLSLSSRNDIVQSSAGRFRTADPNFGSQLSATIAEPWNPDRPRGRA